MEELCSYKLSSERFHTKKLCSRLFSTEVEFYWQKQLNRVLCHSLWDYRGNVHGSSMARWKARGRLPISASSHGWGAMSGYWSKSWFFERERKFQGAVGSSTNDFWRQKTRVHVLSLGVVCVILRLAVLIQYRLVTDRQTDTTISTHTSIHWQNALTTYQKALA